MLKLLDTMTEVLFRPSIGINKAIKNSFTKSLVFLFVLFTLIWFPLLREELVTVSFWEQLFYLVARFSFNILILIFYCLLVHGLVGFLFNVQGNIKQLFSGLVFSYLPFMFLPLVSLLPQWQNSVALQGSISTILFLWTAFLALLAIKNVYQISYWRSNVILVMPLAFGVLLYVSIVFYIFVSFWLTLQIGT